jgi:hypothetical protein
MAKTAKRQQRHSPIGLAAVICSNAAFPTALRFGGRLTYAGRDVGSAHDTNRRSSLQVVQQLATTAHHAQQAATRMVILDVLLEVTGQVIDTGGQQRNLDFRGTGVAAAR